MIMSLMRKPDHFLPLFWAAIALVLVGVLVLEDQFGRPTAGEGPRGPARIAEARLLPAFRLQQDTLAGAQTVERPLFVPGRRSAPAAVGAGPGTMKKGQLVLQGTTLVGALSIAMLKDVATGTVHRVEKGGEILGMTLAEISAEQVVLKAGDDTETLALLVNKGAGSASAAVERGPFGSSAAHAAPPPAGSPAPAAPAAAGIPGMVGGVPGAALGARMAPGGLAVTPPMASPGSAAMTPEEIIARRRAVRRPQPQN